MRQKEHVGGFIWNFNYVHQHSSAVPLVTRDSIVEPMVLSFAWQSSAIFISIGVFTFVMIYYLPIWL